MCVYLYVRWIEWVCMCVHVSVFGVDFDKRNYRKNGKTDGKIQNINKNGVKFQ